VSWLNASERADVTGSSRSRRRVGIGPDWSKIATGSPFRLIELFGGVICSHDGDLAPPPTGVIHPPGVGPDGVGSRSRPWPRRRPRAAAGGRPTAVPSPRGGPNTQEITASSKPAPMVKRRLLVGAGAAARCAKPSDLDGRGGDAAAPNSDGPHSTMVNSASSPCAPSGSVTHRCLDQAGSSLLLEDVATGLVIEASGEIARAGLRRPVIQDRRAANPNPGEATQKSESSRPALSPQHRVRRTALRSGDGDQTPLSPERPILEPSTRT